MVGPLVIPLFMVLPNQGEFRLIKPDRVSHKVAEQIKKLVFNGALKPGDKLPSERELSRLIGVGRFSIREGLRILESMGILETKYGYRAGTYISEIVSENLSERISDIMSLGNITLDQLIEARLQISLIVLKYFYERANAADLRKLEECICEAEDMFKRGAQPREKFIEFHRLIAQGSRNPVFLLLYNSLLDILLKQFLSKYTSLPLDSKKFLTYNKAILNCLKERDLVKASLTMKKYLTYLKTMIKLRTGSNQDGRRLV
jgi:DNA-binding FadR family transcriptional regulator